MQTIASLSERLDMSADQALETLRKLDFDVASIHSELSDDQCDILMDVDETPATLDRLLAELEKKREQERKKAEAARKAAEKKAEAKKKAAAAPKKPAARKSTKKAAAEEESVPESVESAEAPVETPTAEILPEEPVGQEAAPVEIEAAAVETIPDLPVEAAPVEEVPAAASVKKAAVAYAEILPDEPPDAPDALAARPHHVKHDSELHSLAEAERLQEEADRKRKAAAETARPLPTPDPDVVAEVIRRANERVRQKTPRAAETRRGANAGPGGLGDTVLNRVSPIEVLDPSELAERAKRAGSGRGEKKGSGKTARKKQKKAERQRAMEDLLRRDADKAYRVTQAMGVPGGPKKKRKKRKRDEELAPGEVEEMGGTIEVEESMTVEQFANALDMETSDVILDLMDENVMANKNQRIDLELIRKIAAKYNYEVKTVIPEEEDALADAPDAPEELVIRAPVVTVMGHVDHGKTSLLDVVREANVVEGEAGGITQHIAAYDVEMPSGRVVFLDTPGHEAFTQMRARGAKITDVVVLVVAADDGVKPQTIEAIDHAKAAEVPIVVAINKCDKPDAQPDRVRQELTTYGLLDEAWGGKTIMKNISCHTRMGVDELMEMLVLTSQMLDLKANPKRMARGSIVESELTIGHGATAWVLVQKGTLRVGDVFLSGESFGRVRTMTNSRGRLVQEAGPSTPVLVTGFSSPPVAGDSFVVLEEERVARSIAEKRAAINRQRRGPALKRMTLEDFHARVQGAERKTLNIILKADVQGSVDVFATSFAKIGNEEVSVNIVHAGVGGVNESDVMLASASDAVVIGFHVSANAKARKLAEQEGVEIRTYMIIYEAIDEVKKALEGLLTPEARQVITGHAEVRQIFRSSAFGNIAGSIQQDGETLRGAPCRVIRDGTVIFESRIQTLRRNKDDVKSVSAGFECGIKVERYEDVQVGDVIETYRVESVAKTLN